MGAAGSYPAEIDGDHFLALRGAGLTGPAAFSRMRPHFNDLHRPRGPFRFATASIEGHPMDAHAPAKRATTSQAMTTRAMTNRAMTNRDWDRVADSWDEHIMSSLHEDTSGNIAALLRTVAQSHRRILDYGCGIGGYLPLLSAAFSEVMAADTSAACVEQARRNAQALANVTVTSVGRLPRARGGFDAVLMANVLLHPGEAARSKILERACSQLRRGGALILVVPAVESVHLAETVRRLHTTKRKSAYSRPPVGTPFDPGVIGINGNPTKHYSAEELPLVLAGHGLRLTRLERAEYSWRSEAFEGLDRKLKQRPWDWLVAATRR
jgi:SAM-dependent methyltransferase